MTNYQKRTDKNQQKIIDALRAVGFSVFDLSRFGHGFPDLIAGRDGVNYLLEVKTAKGKLTEAEQKFFDEWHGQKAIVRTPEEALEACGFRIDEGEYDGTAEI